MDSVITLSGPVSVSAWLWRTVCCFISQHWTHFYNRECSFLFFLSRWLDGVPQNPELRGVHAYWESTPQTPPCLQTLYVLESNIQSWNKRQCVCSMSLDVFYQIIARLFDYGMSRPSHLGHWTHSRGYEFARRHRGEAGRRGGRRRAL